MRSEPARLQRFAVEGHLAGAIRRGALAARRGGGGGVGHRPDECAAGWSTAQCAPVASGTGLRSSVLDAAHVRQRARTSGSAAVVGRPGTAEVRPATSAARSTGRGLRTAHDDTTG
ncbi:hypothetical protein ACFYOT_30400 [Saccharothrix saharensis]|uniref:hypothetical protein n=1 Tax=Saccharothrix saharensis TaxID=571190 RepID=UPI0036854905